MAMVDQQIANFVQKFRDLWARGLSAHLDLDCSGGEAFVGLRLHLGRHRAGEAQQDQGHGDRHRRGASYARRLARRAAARTATEQVDSAAPGRCCARPVPPLLCNQSHLN